MILANTKFIKYYIFLIFITIIGGFLFIFPDFIFYPTIGIKGAIYTFLHWALNCIPLFLLFYAVSLNKYIFAFSFPLLVFLGTIIGFYSFFYRATLTPMIVDATLNNDIGTTLDVVTIFQVIVVLISIAVAITIVVYRFKHIVVNKKIIHLFFILASFIVIFSINKRVTTSFYQHFPTSLYYNFNEYNKLNTRCNLPRINPDPSLHYKSYEDLTVVFVIGESLRADHLTINGYERNTTPMLANQQNLVSFKNIYSQYTYTNPSVAHILTRADSISTERAQIEKSFISLFKNSNFYTAWLANQDAATTYYSFMKDCDTLVYARPEKSVYTFSNWLDEDLFPIFDNVLKMPHNSKLIILHTIGNHWYYNSHYSKRFQKFSPITRSKIVLQNTPEEIINSYDNSILYTDYFLNSIIEKLLHKNAILIYLADHGEALGEDGNWLHATDNEYLKNPACLIWYSDLYNKKNSIKTASLYKKQNMRFRTDFLYHSILSAANIPSKTISRDLDIFNSTDNTK